MARPDEVSMAPQLEVLLFVTHEGAINHLVLWTIRQFMLNVKLTQRGAPVKIGNIIVTSVII